MIARIKKRKENSKKYKNRIFLKPKKTKVKGKLENM